jgi:hypothetical protein
MRRSVDRMRDIDAATGAAVHAASAAGTAADPFRTAKDLESCRSSLQELDQQLKADAQLHDDAVRSVRDAERELQTLTQLAARAQQDQVPDSRMVTSIIGAVPALARTLQQLRDQIGEPHGDWPGIDAAADSVASEAVRHRSALSNELEQAEAATRGLQSAASAIRSLRGWTGSFGIGIDSGAGQHDFAAARDALSRGEYAAAASLAGRAAQSAQAAVATAEAEERRRRRERERREEEARRAAQRRSESSPAFGSSGGFSSGSSSVSSSRSGFSGSGFSSGSGTARSGW